jgi:hypothetical protein
MSDCPRAGRLFGGCKFRPRFDTVSATEPDVFGIFYSGPNPPRPTPAKSTYICDVCERCGNVLFNRKNTQKQ